MKSKINRAAILFIFILLFIGCGKVQLDTTPKPLNTAEDKNNQSSNTTAEESNEAFLNQKEEAEQTPPPKESAISLKEHYSDSSRYISVLGLKEYRKLEGDFGTDKPAEGNTFLVLFLEIENNGTEKEYFNPYETSADVDGNKAENTILINQPEGYPTIFTNIEPGMAQKGFIVWEVPIKWKKFKFTYTGWKGSDGLTLDAVFSKKDLKSPKKY